MGQSKREQRDESSLDGILSVSDVGSDDSSGLDDGPEDVGLDVGVGRLLKEKRREERGELRRTERESPKREDGLTIPTQTRAP